MFNIAPSMDILRQFLGRGGNPMPGSGGNSGGMMPGIPINPGGGDDMGGLPYQKFPGINPNPGGDTPRMPEIIDAGPTGRMPMPTFPQQSQQPARPMPSSGMGGGMGKMSPQRGGFWGKYNQISQAFQPAAMSMLMGGNRQQGQYRPYGR